MANHNDVRYAKITARTLLYAVVSIMALYYLLPLFVMVITSFKDIEEIRAGNLFSWPESLNVQPWVKAWSSACTGIECNGLNPTSLIQWQ